MKFTVLAAFVGFLALTNGATLFEEQQAATFPVNVGQALKMYYTALKKVMPCGYAPLNIPVLAPFTTNNLKLNFNTKDFSLTGNLSNIYITGLNDYVFPKFDFDQTTGVLSYDTFMPQIQILAETDLDFWAMVAGLKLGISGKTLWDLKFESYRVVGSLVMAPNSAGQMQVSKHKFQLFFGDVKVNNWNENWNIAGNNYNNEWLRNFIMMWTQQEQQEMNAMFNDWLTPVNQKWAQLTEQELISYYVDTSAELSQVDCQA